MTGYSMGYVANNAVYICVACGEDGIVRIGATRDPEGSLRRRERVGAAQWAWIGSESRAKLLVRRLRRQWGARYVLGEGYRFDYALEGRVFRDELDQTFREEVGGAPQWEKLGKDALRLLRATPKRKKRARWY
ncbi:hypothetical protein [Stenotrophomonas maltophilia]|uniref:hypothetical protein n=1 Tax=Stenotrophomonas maltophilia TaxID=40324 RepID=UPI000B4E21B6|nr:hypothetical protein [Stenotrophomonas maltophilia]OWQ58121.1 hypothetical protein CEE59_09120 [Stenotrophomonas maltophilia]HEL5028585.1 hypothetical protein [Stenotrophomonas maltophilia]